MTTKLQKLYELAGRNWRFYAKAEPAIERERLREQTRINQDDALRRRRLAQKAASAWRSLQRVVYRMSKRVWSRADRIQHIMDIQRHAPRLYDWGIGAEQSVTER